jgi:Protein of unknown function (DUF2829)
MNLQDALQAAGEGKKVKLPEWSGYWFIPSGNPCEDGDLRSMIQVFTKDGDILGTPWFEKYQDRTDFEVTEGKLGFGFALAALESGKKVCRAGWNGKGMWLYLVPGSTFSVSEGRPLAAHLPVGEQVNYNPHIDMKAADGSYFAWNPNQLDMLAKDWQVASA